MKDGRYQAQGVDAVLGYSKNGKQQIEILFEICDAGPAKGERISFTGSFSGGAAEYTLGAMRVCGWAPATPLSTCCKNKIEIEVYTETFTGRDGGEQQAQRVRIRTPRTSLQTPTDRRMTAEDGAKFLADLAGVAQPVTPSKPRQSGDDDDDLPFG